MAKAEKICEVAIKDLRPYDKNAKVHSDEQVDMICNSIEEFGFISPCLIDKGNRIIAGHGRVMAAKKLGLKKVPCVYIEGLTEEQYKAYILVDNKLTELGGWDMDLLNEEIDSIELDMSLFGFAEAEQTDVEIDEDDFNVEEFETPREPTSKSGGVYQLGDHILMCGDATKEADVDKLMHGEYADLVVTDPPYNVNVKNSQGMKIANDNMRSDAFTDFLTECFSNFEKWLKPGGAFYIWYASKSHIEFETALNRVSLFVREQLVWVKHHFVLGRSDYHWRHEVCLYGWKDGESHYFIDNRKQSTVTESKKKDFSKLTKKEAVEMLEQIYDSEDTPTTALKYKKPSLDELHPTMKPLGLIERNILFSSKKGEIVLDLFGGSGTTLIACENQGRRCRMMELDPAYCDVIIERWETLTGKKAVLLNG